MKKQTKIWIAGHEGMVGRALVKIFSSPEYELITATSQELDLRKSEKVMDFVEEKNPDLSILAAAKVGGIVANNSYPVNFLQDNLSIAINFINACHLNDVNKIFNLGSSCIYPKYAEQPMKESVLLSGSLEETNQWYAIAKIAAVKLCQAYNKQYGRNYISLMPCNLYGPYDNFNLETSHVIPALIRKAHEAKENNSQDLSVWGSGSPLREFLHVDDLANSIKFLNQSCNTDLINVGSSDEFTIRELAQIVKDAVGFEGKIIFDKTKPDGTSRKKLDTSRLEELGWSQSISFNQGIEEVYNWFKLNYENIRR